jgi:hypothetical protein
METLPDWESEQGLPENLEYIRHTGSRSYYESFIWENQSLILYEHDFADFGDQLNEDTYEGALERISGLAGRFPDTRFWHIRYDHAGWFDESPDNTSYKLIEGKGNVKVTKEWLLENDYLEENGVWYYCR